MKKLFIILSIILSTTFIYGQVERENVVLEIFTCTGCYYCPGAAMGADDLIANGKHVAVMENHNNDQGADPFTNGYASARRNYYGFTANPSSVFDGVLQHIGGNHTQSLYTTFLPKYNQRMGIDSDFDINFEGATSGFVDFEVVFDIEKVNGNYDNVKFHVAITESEIPYNWQGMNHVNFVNRLMVPDQNGTTLNFSSTNTHQVIVNFSIDPSWVNENCEMIAFLQNNQTKEVYQAVKANVMELGENLSYDAAFGEVYVPKTICSETVAPLVELNNYGQETLTSIDITYSVNGGDEATFEWTGTLEQDDSEFVQLSPVLFEVLEDNQITITAGNPNGHEDEYPPNNIVVKDMDQAKNVSTTVTLELHLDNHPEETTWQLVNSLGTILYSGGPYSQSGSTVTEEFELDNHDCYSFTIFDEGGDGMFSSAKYMIYDESFSFMVVENEFGYQDEVQFYMGLMGAEEIAKDKMLNVYPNPFTDQFNVSLNLNTTTKVKTMLVNTLGEIVYSGEEIYGSGANQMLISSENLTEGIYFLILDIDGDIYKEKILFIK